MRTPVAVLALALLAPLALANEPAPRASVRTKRLEVRARTGSRAAADLDRQAVAAERDLDRIAAVLQAEPKGPFTLWVYDDLGELAEVTGTAGTGGFSSESTSHVPYDDEEVRLHELVHVVAYEWPKTGEERRSLFFAEGLANAVLEYVHGVHVHAVAAHYRKSKRLPTIEEMTEAKDFYAWLRAHPGFNAYDVAASWMRFLLETHGVAATKRYYGGAPAKEAFGADLAALEKAWHGKLDAYEIRPELETLLCLRDGEDVRFAPFRDGVPAAILGKPADWTSLVAAKLVPDEGGSWTRRGSAVVGKNDADRWTWCDLGTEKYSCCAVSAKVTTQGTPVELRFGVDNQVMLVGNGTFLYRGDQPIASDPTVRLGATSGPLTIVVTRREKRIEAWVNGRKALSTELGTCDLAAIGVGIHKGSATFEDVRVRPFR